MEKLFENEFIVIKLDLQNDIMLNVWSENTENMELDEYQATADQQTRAFEENTCTNWLIDASQFKFTLTPEIQGWVDNHIFPRIIAAGVQKIGMVMSKDFIVGLSIEQLMEEQIIEKSSLRIKYFGEQEEARNWMLDHAKDTIS